MNSCSIECRSRSPSQAIVDAANAAPSLEIVEGHGGVPLLVEETGDRSLPGILFLHGFGQSYLSFRRQFASTLADRFHLVAFDLRGQGGSGKPSFAAAYTDSRIWADDVEAVILATHLKRPVIVGWSYGGFVAMDYVRHYGPRRIAGIDLVGSLGGLDGGPPHGRRAANGESEGAAETEAEADTRMSRSLDLAENIVAAQHHAAGYATASMTDVERTTLFASELMLPAYVRRAMEGRSLDNRDLLP
jgi:non-heme chloroperoxidase